MFCSHTVRENLLFLLVYINSTKGSHCDIFIHKFAFKCLVIISKLSKKRSLTSNTENDHRYNLIVSTICFERNLSIYKDSSDMLICKTDSLYMHFKQVYQMYTKI
jgi:hypothetical protein